MPKFDVLFCKKAAAEFLVTFLFIFTICANGLNEARSGAAIGAVGSGISTGFAAVALIYCFGGLSGAHFNPAVTVGAVVGSRMDPITGLVYIVVQVIAGIAAVGSLIGLFPDSKEKTLERLILAPVNGVDTLQAVGMEFVLSFILVMVVYGSAMGLKVARSELDIESQEEHEEMINNNKKRLNFAPIAIGLTLGFLCFLGGTISMGAFNPSRATAPAVLSGTYKNLWIYWLGDILGGATAAVVYQYVLRQGTH
jgi:glycerol uptake facilitator-like aquaporin